MATYIQIYTGDSRCRHILTLERARWYWRIVALDYFIREADGTCTYTNPITIRRRGRICTT
jgi:hypothetical protein